MASLRSSDVALNDLRLEEITFYLNRTDWKKIESGNKNFLLFRGPFHDDSKEVVELALPYNSAQPSEDLARTINALSIIENRSPTEIIRSIKSLDKDVLFIRISDPAIFNNSISFDRSVEVMKKFRSLLAYAACAEEDPRAYFPKLLSVGMDYVKKCRFAHTFHGSFGFVIESPLVLKPVSTKNKGRPFERRVLERIMRGLVLIRDSYLNGNLDQMIRSESGELNANVCEAFSEILGDSEESIAEYSVGWSPEVPLLDEFKNLRSVRLEYKVKSFLDSAASCLRSEEEGEEISIRGRITQLKSKCLPFVVEEEGEGEDDEFDGSSNSERLVTVSYTDKSKRVLAVKVNLNQKDYTAACDAHKSGQDVSVAGILEKRKKYWHLLRPKNFAVISTK